ncbi:hypothetical protein DU508_11865 [Pedobacter chinensis]|uniref:Uncharacterized protein n=1 Tax=Pedobacter chinensis TaxID=2282421 RepID=A0A369Q1T4_9SPHI|nr:hypothetical protein DU508_11865 [Pedobacter chinensis]
MGIYLNRKISIPYPNTFNLYTGKWKFFSAKYNKKFSNNIELRHPKTDSVSVSYQVQKDDNDILHIVGYEVTEEGFMIFNFKKIK